MNEVWDQLKNLLTYESTTLQSDQKEQLRDISLACNLLFKRQNETFESYSQPKVSPFNKLNIWFRRTNCIEYYFLSMDICTAQEVHIQM